jgi:glycerate-2-kinase
LGAGKAAANMAAAFEQSWHAVHPDVPLHGLVVTRYDHAEPTESIEVVEAAHPVPDQAGVDATGRILALATEAGSDDLVVFLISGGASALLTYPAPGVSLHDKQQLNRALLKSGMPIDEMNIFRQHFSAVKGGRLAAAAHPAQMVSYLISDVPGDSPAAIGSGPTIISPPAPGKIQALIDQYGLNIDPRMTDAMMNYPAPPDRVQGAVELIAAPQMALEAAAQGAIERGLAPMILGDAMEGEAAEVAKVFAAIAQQVIRHNQPCTRPCALISGGETTVTLRGNGRGGRNGEFLLAFLIAMHGIDGKWEAIAADTDGIDGVEDNAGAIIDNTSYQRATELGLDPQGFLANNDAYGLFEALNALVFTGPTRTNVNDFRAIIIH